MSNLSRPLLLSGLAEGEQRDLLAAAQPRQLKPRDVLGHQGEPADLFALVQIGHLKLAQVNAAGAESLVRFIGPGDCLGLRHSGARRLPRADRGRDSGSAAAVVWLVPMLENAKMEPPSRSAHTLGSHGLAKAILVAWTLGVPSLISGLTGAFDWMIVAGSALLLVGVALNATQAITIVTPD